MLMALLALTFALHCSSGEERDHLMNGIACKWAEVRFTERLVGHVCLCLWMSVLRLFLTFLFVWSKTEVKICMDVFVTNDNSVVACEFFWCVWTLSTKLKYVCCLRNNVSCEIICHWWPSSFYQSLWACLVWIVYLYLIFIFIFIPIRGILNL